MIESFKKKELKNKLSLQTQASAWREAMYAAMTKKNNGVDPRALFAQVNAALVAWEGGADGAFKAPGDARAFDYTRYACYTNDPNCTV